MQPSNSSRPFLTPQDSFNDVSRGNPKPHTLKGDALVQARLTSDTWRLEITSDGSSQLAKPRTITDGSAITMKILHELGKKHAIRFLKAMQCNNIEVPLGEGLWEGVPLREVLRLAGRVNNVRRIYYWGFHNNDPKQLFQSSMDYNHALETPPWDIGPFIAYKLNGEPISLKRGGPVRMVVPWAHGFKSIKWLQSIVLTNDYKANDTYADGNNDVESYLKTAAYLGDGPTVFKAGMSIHMNGTAMCGWSGLKHIEYWLRPDTGTHGKIADEDPAWNTAHWQPCEVTPPPENWKAFLPAETDPSQIWGFDRETGKPPLWPLRFSVATWSVDLGKLSPGAYEFRVRTVDLNGFAQPEPRPYQKSGMNKIQSRQIMVTA